MWGFKKWHKTLLEVEKLENMLPADIVLNRNQILRNNYKTGQKTEGILTLFVY